MQKEKITVWHKPSCSKCRDAMAYIKNHAVLVDEWREYLVDVPSEDEIRGVLKKLDIPAVKLVRTKESVYQEKFAGKKMTEAKWIKALHKYPILIQRPIVIIGDKAFFGRSEEDLEQLL
jgi:arsenate reductase